VFCRRDCTVGVRAVPEDAGLPTTEWLRARAHELAVMNPLWRPAPAEAGDFVTVAPGRDQPFLDADEAACRVLGYPRAVLLQHSVRDLIPLPPGADRVDTLASVRDHLLRGIPITYETIVRRRDGSLLPVRMTMQRMLHVEGVVYRGIFLDLSREREAQVRAVQMEKQRLLQEIGASLAHELNSPLSVILGNLEMVLEEHQDPELADLLRPVQGAALRIAASVQGLHQFARPTASSGWTTVDLSQLAALATEATRPLWDTGPRARGRGIKLRLETPPVAPVRGNPVELQAAVQELVANAVQALPDGGSIVVQTGQDDREVFLRVSDTGVGMNDDVRQRCLDPFFTTRRPMGSGLGLNRVFHSVLQHRGHLQIESTEGRGTRVTIAVPRSPATDEGA
jgi:PAS domain S-box-containing protein